MAKDKSSQIVMTPAEMLAPVKKPPPSGGTVNGAGAIPGGQKRSGGLVPEVTTDCTSAYVRRGK